MAESFAAIENFVRLAPVSGGAMKLDEEYIHVDQAFQCDSTFFQIFDGDLIAGNLAHVLDDPGSMVVTESFAARVFGNRNPVGCILTLPAGQYYSEDTDFIIKGIMKDFPQNSHFHPEFITTPIDRSALEFWAWTYLLLKEKSDPETIVSGFRDFYVSHFEADLDEVDVSAHLQNISDIHLNSRKTREIEINSNNAVIYSFSIAALLLLFIALVNYSNLNIGMAGYSDRYLYIGKVFGSSNRMQLKYFLTEGIVITLISLLGSGLMVVLSANYIEGQFSLNLFDGNLRFVLLIVLLFSLLAVLAGSLPLLRQFTAAIRSSLNLTGNGRFQRKGISKGLIVVQNTISIALIITVFVIHRQTSYALSNSLVVENENMVCMEYVHTKIQQRFPLFKEELLKYSSVRSVSAMMEPPGGETNDMFRFKMEGFVADETKEANDRIGIFPCDYSFASLFNLEFIGVVKDFHLSSLKRVVEPLVLFKRKNLWLINIVVSFQPGMQTTGLSDLERVWKELYPGYPLQYKYVDSMYKDVYSTEFLQANLLTGFTLIALFICSMGFLGLSLLTLQRRIKEIGIRKVNGAGTKQILILLSLDFIKWIILSFMIAVPIAWLSMNKWLESFVYKTDLSWWLFALAGVIAVTIALLTVSIQTWRASRRNPLEALRYE